jgi:polyisoprenyl-phosphate glycosyltransferase
MSIDTKCLSIVIPVYFNGPSLLILAEDIRQFEEELDKRQMTLDLIFVDDGSKDDSFNELMKIKQKRPQTKVIKLSRNFGAVAASKRGFQYVEGDCFSILSADLQDPISQVLRMLDEWLAGNQFIFSVRAKRKDPFFTKLFASVYYKLLHLIVSKTYPKGGFDLMLMDKIMLPYMQNSAKNTNPNMFAYWLGVEPKILQYQRNERKFGKSRWTFRKKLRLMLDTFTGFSVLPLQIISLVGLITASASFFYGAYMFTVALLYGLGSSGFATLVVLLSFFSGLLLLTLSIIGEYIWRIFEIVSEKPESIVQETHL